MRLRALALASLALGSAAAAQAPATVADPAPPAVMIVPSPPPIRVVPPTPSWAFTLYSSECGPGALSAAIDTPDAKRAVLPRNQDGPLLLIACDDTAHTAKPVIVDTLDSALVFLAYKPFEPFWPQAEELWGDDLGKLRAELHDRALSLRSSQSSYAVGAETAVAINKGHALVALGYFDEARAIMAARMSELLEMRERGELEDDFDLVLLAIAQAAGERAQHGYAAAADFLAGFMRTVDVDEDYAINLTVNRAAYLAEAGRYNESLALLKPAQLAFEQQMINDENYHIGGSEREFSWILACAYSQKGDAREAAQFAEVVNSAEESPMDEYMQATKPSTLIRLRMTRCSNDPQGYFAAWRKSSQPILSPAWLEFQKEGATRLGVPRKWVSTRPEARDIAALYRQLPPRYEPALRRWRPAAPPAD